MDEIERRAKYTEGFRPDNGHESAICVKCGTIKKHRVHYWKYEEYKPKCSDERGKHEWMLYK